MRSWLAQTTRSISFPQKGCWIRYRDTESRPQKEDVLPSYRCEEVLITSIGCLGIAFFRDNKTDQTARALKSHQLRCPFWLRDFDQDMQTPIKPAVSRILKRRGLVGSISCTETRAVSRRFDPRA